MLCCAVFPSEEPLPHLRNVRHILDLPFGNPVTGVAKLCMQNYPSDPEEAVLIAAVPKEPPLFAESDRKVLLLLMASAQIPWYLS